MSWTRRRVLGAAGLLAGASAAGMLGVDARAAEAAPSRRIVLRNLHTPDSLDIVYRRGDEDYVPEAMSAIQALLRDYRTGAQHPIDPRLMDYLCDVARHAGVEPVFSVISGYRSPQTNRMLHERSSEVATHSLHMEGRAIDVRLAGVDCARLADRALGMRRGGVGYYRNSDFVHLDTGRLRSWKG
ncbi:MAG TPA: DUF882 domain-containing protein [Steroidobacteraceae bacterium]|jgi:uncharacterized protein YcbK (DUF882 family)|nr:DUF882 domain-containing protein [Steroidobacteraceae bacterium]